MKEVFINGRFLTQKITGVQRFAIEITKYLARRNIKLTILVPKHFNNNLYFGLNSRIIKTGNLKSHFWEQISLRIFLLKHNKPLLINFTGIGPLFYKNQIITIHDLSFLRYPKWFSRTYYYFYKVSTIINARSSREILTVSNFSKQEIIELLSVPKSKIKVLYNAQAFPIIESTRKAKGKYILCVSSIDPRKNLIRLVKAYHLIKNHYKIDLIIVGGKSSHFSPIEELKDTSIIWKGRVSDDELGDLYKNADLFVYPSLYEGFGIPPLEAMANGCPVLLSDIPVFHEIFEKATIFFNPTNIDDIASKISYLLDNESVANKLIAEGYKCVKRYSWDKSAEILLGIINS